MANNNTHNFDCFIPLDKGSQNGDYNVLFFDSSLHSDVLHQAAMLRYEAAYNLLDRISLFESDRFPIDISSELSKVICILLSDANSLMAEFMRRAGITSQG